MNYLSTISMNMWLGFFAAVLVTIGCIVAYKIKSTDSVKVQGDKRLVATVFLMSALIVLAVIWARSYCKSGISQSLYDATGYDSTRAARMRAAGL